MLLCLRIENFALVDRLDLELGKGLTVLTGETGAGKSIILDALDAALGGKVTGRAIRTGAEKALIEATFQLDEELKDWLNHQSIGCETGTLVCSREVVANTTSQRSRSRVNGALVNKQQMEELRDRLVELTAQGQTVQIGQPALQREWLDCYGGTTLLKQREAVAAAFTAYQQATQALENRRRAEQQRLQQLDLFDYQLRELNAANLDDPDELDLLEQEAKRLSHSVELQQQSYVVYQALYQNDNDAEAETCTDLLGKAENILQDMVEYDTQLRPILELVTAALAQVEEAGREINAYGESIEADPQRLQEAQVRIAELKQVCRKYGPTLTEAIAMRDRLQEDLLELTGGGQSVEELEQAVQTCHETLIQACTELTNLRQTAAKDLETRLVNELKPLAMEKVKFEVGITPCPPSATGADQITYLFSPNPGEPLQPLTEIASGGEMSRFLLALQASFSQVDSVGTLVFDEIDVGVSGRVTQAIAEKLYQLSQHHQVLCVTHQPIVAAMADHHFRVSKHLIGANGETASTPLENGNGYKAKGKRQKAKGRNQESGVTSQESEEIHPPPCSAPIPSASPPDAVRTVVRVMPLTDEQRKQELALLAGGQTAEEASSVTDAAAYAFAESLLAQAAHLRQAPSAIAPTSPVLEPATKARSARSKSTKRR
ncbi:MAG: DNA repair protein RecN [Oscillatoriales cyanobacterium C42_A2020_001]|nr:DNA repair protein RecN [Leptolyngbyaceae cyanobacterium C42_A2020_001]